MSDNGRGYQEISAFGELMQRELEANSGKGCWKEKRDFELALGAMRDLGKLVDAMDRGDREKVIEQCVDTANMCMMIVDVLGGLE